MGEDRAERLVNGGEVGPSPTASAADGTAPARGELVGHVCDVTDAEAVAAWVESVRAAEGRIDVAIHVAGIIQVGPVESSTLGHFRAAIDTMLLGPVHLCLAVLPTMLEAGAGRIGVVSSVGDYSWGGAASTAFYVDPVEDLTVTFYTQLLPSSTLPIRSYLRQLVNQALV